MSFRTDDFAQRRRAAVSALLRQDERVEQYSVIARSPGVEDQSTSSAGDVLSVMNPFNGFGKVARDSGFASAFLALAMGEAPDDTRWTDALARQKALREFGRTFCGTWTSAAGHLLVALRRHCSPEFPPERAVLAVLTDQRFLAFADQQAGERSADRYWERPGLAAKTAGLAGAALRGARGLVRDLRGERRSPLSIGSLVPVFEIPRTVEGRPALAARPAAPIGSTPRTILYFADQSWLVVSFGRTPAGAAFAERLTALLP